MFTHRIDAKSCKFNQFARSGAWWTSPVSLPRDKCPLQSNQTLFNDGRKSHANSPMGTNTGGASQSEVHFSKRFRPVGYGTGPSGGNSTDQAAHGQKFSDDPVGGIFVQCGLTHFPRYRCAPVNSQKLASHYAIMLGETPFAPAFFSSRGRAHESVGVSLRSASRAVS